MSDYGPKLFIKTGIITKFFQIKFHLSSIMNTAHLIEIIEDHIAIFAFEGDQNILICFFFCVDGTTSFFPVWTEKNVGENYPAESL